MKEEMEWEDLECKKKNTKQQNLNQTLAKWWNNFER